MRFLFNIVWKLRQKQPLILEMLVAVCLAFLIWLYAHCRAQDTLDNVLIPISLQMSPGQRDQYELDIQGPRQVTVSFAGSSSRIRELRRLLQRGQVKAVIPCAVPEFHLKDGRFSEKIVVEPGHIAVPPGVRMVLMEDGSQLQVTFHRMVERQLPVRLGTSPCRGAPASDSNPASHGDGAWAAKHSGTCPLHHDATVRLRGRSGRPDRRKRGSRASRSGHRDERPSLFKPIRSGLISRAGCNRAGRTGHREAEKLANAQS